MRKWVVFLSLFSGLVISSNAVAVNEFTNHTNVAKPTSSKYFSKTLLVDRYVLPDYSNVSFEKLLRSVIKDLGSDNSKKVRILWTDVKSKKLAVKIRNALISANFDGKSITVGSVDYKRSIYPLYVEIVRVGSKRANCKVDTAERFFDIRWGSCATDSNYRIQEK